METKIILPELDIETLQQKANEFAMKGALKTLEEFYCDWNSPYRKAIAEHLEKQELGYGMKLPDIVAVLNDSLSKEIDAIANAAIAKTYVPMVKSMLVRAEKTMLFSELLKEFIDVFEYDSTSPDDFNCEVHKRTSYDWLEVKLSCKDKEYEFVLYLTSESKKQEKKTYHIINLPRHYSGKTMNLVIDDAKLEIPFTQSVLQDKFTAAIATLIIAETQITMDCEEFYPEMFPEQCHCD